MTANSKLALVTGAAGIGPGQAIARSLAEAGHSVVVTDMHEGRMKRVVAQMAADYPAVTIVGHVLDVGDTDRISHVIDEVVREHGPITVLVNDAAQPAHDSSAMFGCSLEEWHRALAVNLTGPWYLARLVMPVMKEAGGGVVVNIGTYASDIGVEGAYAIGKGALNVLTRVCAREGGQYGIRAVTVTTGYIADSYFAQLHPEMSDTPVTRSLLGSHAVSAEIGAAVAFLVSDAAAHITGETLNIAAGSYMRV